MQDCLIYQLNPTADTISLPTMNGSHFLGYCASLTLLTDSKLVGHLFPDGFFAVDEPWLPLIADAHNLRMSAMHNNVIITEGNDRKPEAISFGKAVPISMGTTYNINFYGNGTREILENHFVLHVNHALKVCNPNKNVSLKLHAPKHCEMEAISGSLVNLSKDSLRLMQKISVFIYKTEMDTYMT